ncbi:Serpin-ZX-like protein [Drosera capensis]
MMEWCMEVAKQLMLENKDKNVVISPLSLNVMLNMLSVFTQDTEEQRRLLGILQCATVEDVNRISEEIMSLQAFEDEGLRQDDVDDEAGYYNQEPVVCISYGAWINESFRIHPSSQQILETVYKSPIRFVDLQGQGLVRHLGNGIVDLESFVKYPFGIWTWIWSVEGLKGGALVGLFLLVKRIR